MSGEGFLWLLAAVVCVTEACLQQCKRVRGLMEESLKGGRIPRTQWGPLLQGMQEAAQAVSEVSHGRWAKLLASRSAHMACAAVALQHEEKVLCLWMNSSRSNCWYVPVERSCLQMLNVFWYDGIKHHDVSYGKLHHGTCHVWW